MNLVNELENELVFALLIEKKHVEKINSENALALIAKIKMVLQSIAADERLREPLNLPTKKRKKAQTVSRLKNLG
ncbi:MAG: hypothetical protein M3525_06935 [Acidobacteriota bacterium]|nr:hypothetical protein [Acidobacteriota bacterium]